MNKHLCGKERNESSTSMFVVPPAVAMDHPVAQGACVCGVLPKQESKSVSTGIRGKMLKKTAILYVTMVVVSTFAIFLLEHATILGALRTALVAAIGKTVAAAWVTSFFD